MTCRYDTMYYGGYEFDGFVTTSLNTEAVRADDGFTTKYFKHTIESEFIITERTRHIGTVESNTIDSVDADLDYIRQVLMKPHQSLNLAYRGAGRGNVSSQWDSEFSTLLETDITGEERTLGQYGMGAIPEVLFWEPLANNRAVRCKWRCVFFTSKASIPVLTHTRSNSDMRSDRPKSASEILENTGWNWEVMVLSVTEEQEVDINEEGFIVATIKGVIEFSGEKTVTDIAHWAPTNDANSKDYMEYWIDNPKLRKSVMQALSQYFEPYQPLGFTRKQRYVFNKENRKLEYVITDTETPNPRAKFPRIVSYTATHEVSSSLFNDDIFSGSGFLTWDTVFQGQFTVAPGYWMGWAWVAMMVIVKQRINRTVPLAGDAQQVVKDDKDAALSTAVQTGQDAAKVARKVVVPKHLMTSVRVKEHIHDRKVDISLRYLVISTLNQLFKNSGLFTSVHSMFVNDNSNLDGSGTPYLYTVALDDPSDFGKNPMGNPSQWMPTSKASNLSYQRAFLKQLSQNAFGYSGLGLPNYNVVFDPDNQNLPSITYNANQDPGTAQNKTISYTQNPVPYLNEQKADIYAANRRHHHWVDHPDYANGRGEADYTDSQNPQKANTAPGGSRNPQTSVQYPGADTNISPFIPYSDKAHTWVSYDANFKLIEKSNSTYLQTIDAIDPATLTQSVNTHGIGNRQNVGWNINGKLNAVGSSAQDTNPVPYGDGYVFAHGKPVYFVRFTGYAVRAGYQIPMPFLFGLVNTNVTSGSIVTLPVYRVGTQYWEQKQLNQSADIPLFYAEWDLLYAIKGDPTCGNIGFNHSRPSEFA